MTIATNITKVLIELTGEPRIELAILDAVEHRIEKLEKKNRRIHKNIK